jgi:hypothetical protein
MNHIWAILFGLGWGFPIQLVGIIYVSETIAIFYVILNLKLGSKFEQKELFTYFYILSDPSRFSNIRYHQRN